VGKCYEVPVNPQFSHSFLLCPLPGILEWWKRRNFGSQHVLRDWLLKTTAIVNKEVSL